MTSTSATPADATARSFEVTSLGDELGTDALPHAVNVAYWLGVHCAQARALDREVRYASDEMMRAYYTNLRDSRVASADNARRDLKAALASDVGAREASAPGRIVAEFDSGTDAREYAKVHGYTVTPGINYLFAVRELTP